jgi:hypothetical protein
MRVFLLLALFSLATTVMGSDLTVRLRDHSAFLIQVDNSYFNKPETRFTLSNISEGYHYLQVYKVFQYGATKLIFKGHIYIPGNSMVKAVVERDRRIKVTTETMIPGPSCVDNTPAPVNVPVAISRAELNDIISSADKISFSSTKLATVKNALNGKYVMSSQVAELVKLFVFESDKIDLAKYCYDITLDKSRYYVVNDSFSFSSSIDELNEFIKNRN